MKDKEIIMGIVYNPCTKEAFFAEKGKGAFMNNKRIKVSNKNKIKDALLAFALPSEVRITKKTLSLLSKIFGSVRGVRNPGSAALNMCYVAAGKFDLFLSLSLNSWDAAAGFLVVEEAGGKVTLK
jgi:myo-inositol-1(or 4)-monophosphatase